MKNFTNHFYTLVYIGPPRNIYNGDHKCNELLNTVKKVSNNYTHWKKWNIRFIKKIYWKLKKTLQHGNIEINLNWLQ